MNPKSKIPNPKWKPIGAGLYDPVAVAPKPGRIVLFARNASGELVVLEGDGLAWSEGRSLGMPIAQHAGGQAPVDWPLAACSSAPNRIDLFARSPDGELLHSTGEGETWSPFENLGAPAALRNDLAIPIPLASPPAVCRSRPGRLDVFALGQEGDLLHTWRDGEGWSGFESLGRAILEVSGAQQPLPLSGTPAVCACGPAGMGVFVLGPLGDLLLTWWDGRQWSGFTSLGAPDVSHDLYPALTVTTPLAGPPAACSWGPERLDVFVRGPGGDLLHKGWDGEGWSDFESLWMPLTRDAEPQRLPFLGAVTACTWGENRLDVFARALDGHLYHARWDGGWDRG